MTFSRVILHPCDSRTPTQMKGSRFGRLNLHLYASAKRCSSESLHQVEANPRLSRSQARSDQELEKEQMSHRGSGIIMRVR